MNDPARDTDNHHLESLLGAVSENNQSATNTTVPPAAGEDLAGAIGGFLKPLLQETNEQHGPEGVNRLLQTLGQRSSSPEEIGQAVGSDKANAMVENAAQKTGLDSSLIWKMLPVVLPAVISLLQSGRRSNAQPGVAGNQSHLNPILSQFLDTDGDGDVDMSDTVRLASRFLATR